MTLVTRQTGKAGRVVHRVLVEEGLQIARELYLSLVLDRAAGKPVMMASAAGGMDIEEVAAKTPEKIVQVYIEPSVGLVPFEARQLGFGIGLDAAQVNKFVAIATSLYDAFVATDASLIEINPLLVTADGRSAGARREDGLRRQRALPSSRHSRAAGSRRRRSARDRSVEVLAQLHSSRRQHRLHGQRRRAGDGDDGHHQAGRRRAGEFPRRRRRRQRRSRSATPSRF